MASFHDDNGTLEVRHRHEVIRIQAWGADSARVRAAQHRIPAGSAGATRDVYLPAGRTWISAATGDRHDGGATVRVPLSADHIPVFTPEGAEVRNVIR